MSIPSTAITGFAADLRIQQLDLATAELHQCMFAGYSAAATCTDHEPRSLPGTMAWGKSIGHLRDVLKPRKWTADRAANYETAVHPSNSHAIAICAGTSQTGIADSAAPRTKTPKGPATSRAVRRNAQMSLALGPAVMGVERVADKHRETWILLHYFDRYAEEIRLELSSPLTMEGKHITDWSERIILPPLVFATDREIDFTHDPEPEDELAIDIDVPRRRAD